MEKKIERIFWPDFIRVIACVCVVVVHFNANVSNYFTLDNGIGWNSPLDIYLGTIGVNLFFMISGAMLMHSHLNKGTDTLCRFYYKRFISLYPMYWIAFIIATCVTFVVNGSMPKDGIGWMLNSISGFNGYLYALQITPMGFYQLGEWFLGCIICLYIIAPYLLKGIDKNSKLTSLICFVIFLLCLKIQLPQKFFLLYVPHFLVGMLIIKYVSKFTCRLCFLALFVLIFAYVYPFRQNDGVVYSFISCLCLFVLMASLAQSIRYIPFRKVVSWVAQYSYAIFLVHHWLIVFLCRRFDLQSMAKRDVWLLFFIYLVLTLLFSKGLFLLDSYIKDMLKKLMSPKNTRDVFLSN